MSGGQTGVDRAALEVALELGMECGGWCPRGRRAEDGRIPDRFPLRETATPRYPERTRLNVRDSDATLILTRGGIRGGTALTAREARRQGRALLVVDLDGKPDAGRIRVWLVAGGVRVLNVAGPRESERPGTAERAAGLLRSVFRLLVLGNAERDPG
ncbi:MAG: putative molybdenum carrier protein [Acidobacteriota bacterium]